MRKEFPDLKSDLIPGVGAGGFFIGESLSEVEKKIGNVKYYGPEIYLRDILPVNVGWVGVERRFGFEEQVIFSYRYKNDLVSLYFEDRKVLYRVAVGKGYEGDFYGVRPSDNIRRLFEFFDLEFNSDEDEFLLKKNGEILTGISFVTDYRASLEHAPEQKIQYISIHDWSLR